MQVMVLRNACPSGLQGYVYTCARGCVIQRERSPFIDRKARGKVAKSIPSVILLVVACSTQEGGTGEHFRSWVGSGKRISLDLPRTALWTKKEVAKSLSSGASVLPIHFEFCFHRPSLLSYCFLSTMMRDVRKRRCVTDPGSWVCFGRDWEGFLLLLRCSTDFGGDRDSSV
ncbi:hypothetical protein IE53DRAFT_22888 [Violaceomyces palustris]|uniref:Uncharacterized protein n=1 Tax=Violaceomyces palustris TaxID=1673888 RepID=A0ACD0P224_9BASI|nr:hypothetical protein IE53DRAFT_22888 [Violaceomyces palustris]